MKQDNNLTKMEIKLQIQLAMRYYITTKTISDISQIPME